MQLVYGPFQFPVNGSKTTITTRLVQASSGRPLRYVCQLSAEIWLLGNGQAACTALELALDAAAEVPYQNVILVQDSGLPSGTALFNAGSISGVRVVDGPRYENSAQDAEYVTQRTAKMVWEAEYVAPGSAAAMVSYVDVVSITGDGGPVYSWRHLVNAPPIQQITYPYSTIRITQQGTAVGHLAWPNPPAPAFSRPIFNGAISSVTQKSPERLGQAWINWPVSWNYVYEGLGPLLALPTLPPL